MMLVEPWSILHDAVPQATEGSISLAWARDVPRHVNFVKKDSVTQCCSATFKESLVNGEKLRFRLVS